MSTTPTLQEVNDAYTKLAFTPQNSRGYQAALDKYQELRDKYAEQDRKDREAINNLKEAAASVNRSVWSSDYAPKPPVQPQQQAPNAQLQQKLADANKEVRRLTAAETKLTTKVQQLEQKLKTAENAKTAAENRVTQLIQNGGNVNQQQLAAATQKVSELTAELANIRNEKQAAEDRLNQLRQQSNGEIEQLKKQLLDKEAELTQAKKDLSRATDNLNEVLDKLQAATNKDYDQGLALTNAQNSLNEAQADVSRLTTELQTTNATLAQKQKDYEELDTKSTTQRNAQKREIKELQEQLDESKRTVDAAAKNEKACQVELAKLNKLLEDAKKGSSEPEQESIANRTRVVELEKEVELKTTEITQLSSRVAGLEAKNKELAEELQNAQNDLATQISGKNAEIRRLADENTTLQTTNGENEQLLKQNIEMLETQERTTAQQQTEINDLKRRNLELTTKLQQQSGSSSATTSPSASTSPTSPTSSISSLTSTSTTPSINTSSSSSTSTSSPPSTELATSTTTTSTTSTSTSTAPSISTSAATSTSTSSPTSTDSSASPTSATPSSSTASVDASGLVSISFNVNGQKPKDNADDDADDKDINWLPDNKEEVKDKMPEKFTVTSTQLASKVGAIGKTSLKIDGDKLSFNANDINVVDDLMEAILDVFFGAVAKFSDIMIVQLKAGKGGSPQFHKLLGEAWSTTFVPLLQRIVAAFENTTAAKDDVQIRLAKYAAYIFVRGATGRETENSKDGRTLKWPKDELNKGAFQEDWFAPGNKTKNQKSSPGTRNTLTPYPLMPPMIAALVYTTNQPIETAMESVFMAVNSVSKDNGWQFAASKSSKPFFETFFTKLTPIELNKFALEDAQNEGTPRSANMAKKLGLNNTAITVQKSDQFVNDKDREARSYLVLGRIIFELSAKTTEIKDLTPTPTDEDRQKQSYVLVGLVHSFFVDFTVKDLALDPKTSIFNEFGERPKKRDGKYIKTAARGFEQSDVTINSDAINLFRKKLSEAIATNELQASTSMFVRDASSLTDSRGKTIFQIIDERDKNREFTVLVPENDAWQFVRRTVTSPAALMRLLKRHVIWSPKAIDFATVSGRPITYTTLLYDDNANDPDASIYISGSKAGYDGKQPMLLVRYMSRNQTQEIGLRKQSSRGITGRFFVTNAPLWLDAPGLEPSVGGYPNLPPPPSSSSIYSDLPIFKNKDSETTTQTQTRLVRSTVDEMYQETSALLRKAGVYDDVAKLVAANQPIALLLPPAEYVKRLLGARPSANVLRETALYHIVFSDTLLSSAKACMSKNQSLIVDTASKATIKLTCTQKSGAKNGRLYAGDIDDKESALVQLSGIDRPLMVIRIRRVLRPRGPMMGTDAVKTELKALVMASQSLDAVKKLAQKGDLVVLLPPRDKVRDLFVNSKSVDDVRAVVLQHTTTIKEISAAATACRAGKNAALLTTSGKKLQIVCTKPEKSANELSARRLLPDKMYLVKLDDETPSIAVWLVPNVLSEQVPVAATSVKAIAYTPTVAPSASAKPKVVEQPQPTVAPSASAKSESVVNNTQANLIAQLSTALSVDSAVFVVNKLTPTLKSGTDTSRANYKQLATDAINKNTALDQEEKAAVRKALQDS